MTSTQTDTWIPAGALSEPARAAVGAYMSEGDLDPDEQCELIESYQYRERVVTATELVAAILDRHPDYQGWDWDRAQAEFITRARACDEVMAERGIAPRMVNHGASVWPVILTAQAWVIEDGWHRLHSYLETGLTHIPTLELRSR